MLGSSSKYGDLDFSVNTSGVGSAVRNPQNTRVNTSDNSQKLYACKYCNKLLKGKISRHLATVHKNEDEIRKLNLIPKMKREKGKKMSEAAKARQKIIEKERSVGNFKFNLKASSDDTAITVRRTSKPEKTLKDYRTCPKCKGFFAKRSIYKHIPKCLGVQLKGSHPINTMHNAVLGDIHENASPQLRKVAAKLRQDDPETIVIKYDTLIIAYGNLQASKFQTSEHHGSQIRAELRLLARLLLTLQDIDPSITSLSLLFDPTKFNVFIEAVNKLGKYDFHDLVMKSPATARDVGRIIKIVKKIYSLECSESNRQDLLIKAKEFMRSFKVKFPILIGATVAESQTQMNITKGAVQLPKLEDIQKLSKYLVKKRKNAYEGLKNKEFSFKTWKELAETTLISIQLLNRRRPGEIERLKLAHYNSLEKINKKHNPDVYNKLNKEAKDIVKKYSRILIRGKRNKKVVPVLIDEEMHSCIELVIQNRKKAGVTSKNPYVFALPSVGQHLKWLEACPLLKKFAKACNADVPHTLKATELRKHIATAGISLNLSNNEIQDLSNYMGHDISIHLGTYRQRLPLNDILQMSQLLEKAQGVVVEMEDGLVEADSEDGEDEEILEIPRIFPKKTGIPSGNDRVSITDEDQSLTSFPSTSGK